MRIKSYLIIISAAVLLSCNANKTAVIWTDRPEFALYCEYFNTSQDHYKVTVRYFDYPADELVKSVNMPDIIVGNWLKNSEAIIFFKSLDNILGAKKLSRTVFYQKLINAGRIERNQFLLPVSFNVPALVFSKDRDSELSNPFLIGFDEIKTLSKKYNTERNGVYTRMGFSPLWNSDFLFIVSTLFGASFREASPFTWDKEALEHSMDFVYNWTHEINTNNRAEEDFTYKYFVEPPAKLLQSGRILFTFMDSGTLFTLSEDIRNNIDFRWLTDKNIIPLSEASVYMGIPKKAKSLKAAESFVQWFFKVETQRLLLEMSKLNYMNEDVFGICGGFSALVPVTEQIYPHFYPELLGRMPPSEFLTPANAFPANWVKLKERVVLPYLQDRAHTEQENDSNNLEKRIHDWMRVNR
jgi:ABC-type glycerol-3-phosphate transport system substrate-binding protein